MKKLICAVVCALACASLLPAQKPQIAFRLLDDYIIKEQAQKEKSRLSSGLFGLGFGAVLLGGSAATWFFGDQAYSYFGGGPSMDPMLKTGLSIGLAAGGGVCVLTGIDTLARPSKSLKDRYADVYGEQDSEVQEAMAVATLKYLSEKARNRRLGAIISDGSWIVTAIGCAIGDNFANSLPWFHGLQWTVLGQSYFIGDGIGKFFFKSDAELLYDKYLTAREALYSSSMEKEREKNVDSGAKNPGGNE
jgi:hypothetical protein